MACVRGRCPCWPQVEPFDAAEMALLGTVQEFMTEYTSRASLVLWARVVKKTLDIRPRRRAYVLSTPVNGVILLGRVRFETGRLRWLLTLGVCPNSFWCLDALGWTGGPLHPGRPAQCNLISPFAYGFDSDEISDLLLSAGACPQLGGTTARVQRPAATRQWSAWHARASRRTWTAMAMVRKQGKALLQ
jgi:hypothetical protein